MLYLKFLAMHIKVQLQNRKSFIIMTIGQALMAFTGVFVVLVIMDPQQVVMGFNRHEVLVGAAVVMVSFSLAECFGRGFDTFPVLLSNGQFDRFMLRPQNIIYQIFTSTMDFTRLGRVFVALIVLFTSLQQVKISSYWLLISMIVSGMIVFVCLFIIYGALCFFTTESLEFMNILTDGAREFGKVPFSFYGKRILNFLTFVVPLACFQYYPMLELLGKEGSSIYAYYPLFALAFILPSYGIWKVGIKHYRSTGS